MIRIERIKQLLTYRLRRNNKFRFIFRKPFSIEDKDNIAPRVKLDAIFFYYYVIN